MRHIFFGKPVVRLRRPPANGFEPSGLNRKLRNFKKRQRGRSGKTGRIARPPSLTLRVSFVRHSLSIEKLARSVSKGGNFRARNATPSETPISPVT
jgi:hypothetical protein